MTEILNSYNLDLFAVGITTATIGIFGFVVFFNNRKDATNRAFLGFSLAVIAWSIFNYISYQFGNQSVALLLVRLTIFFATWYAFFSFQLFYVLPDANIKYSRSYKYLFLPWVIFISVLTLTPLVFSSIELKGVSHVPSITLGYAAPLFIGTLISLNIGALYVLFKKIRGAVGDQKIQFKLIWTGALVTFSLHIILSMIFPALLGNLQFVPWGAVFTFPLLVGIVYAIIEHHLLNVKIFAAEILTLLILFVSLFGIVLSNDILETTLRMITFIVLLTFGILLIRSFRKEIAQRESLRKLNAELDDLNRNLQTKIEEQTKEIRKAYEVEKIAHVELEKLHETKNQFMMLTQHHLRTPLTQLRWYLDCFDKGEYGVLSAQMHGALKGAMAATQRLGGLVETFLDVAQFKMGKTILSPVPTSLRLLIEEAIEELRWEIENAKIKIEYVQMPEKWPTLVIDPEKIKEVFFVVLQNAVRYNHPEGKITIAVERSRDAVLITFSDTGVGVPKEEQDMLFDELFYRGASVKNVNAIGAGIGLAVSRFFVEAHGGRIWLESEGSGKGSRVYIELPLGNDQQNNQKRV